MELTHERELARVQRQEYDIRLQGELDRSARQHKMTSTDVQAHARAEVENIRSDLAREAIERMDQMQIQHSRETAAMQAEVDQARADYDTVQSRPSARQQLGPLKEYGDWHHVQLLPTSTHRDMQQSRTVVPLRDTPKVQET